MMGDNNRQIRPEGVDSVTVLGAGTLGHGIAQVVAHAGYKVTLNDVDPEVLESALTKISSSLENIDPEKADTVLDRIRTTTDKEEAFSQVDFVIEAVPEDLSLKHNVFSEAEALAPEGTILATNSSTLPTSEIAEATSSPENVVGLHFSNPVPLMEVVEVIAGEATSDRTFQTAREFGESLGKTPVLVEKDVPGFLLNRINIRLWNEAMRQVDHHDVEPAVVDAAVRRLGFPMGPFEVLDFTGLDIVEMAEESMAERGVPLHVPESLRELTDTGHFGMKTGTGFYEYPAPGQYARADLPTERRYEFDPRSLIAAATNEAVWLIENDVANRDEIDKAVQIGMSWPRGLLEIADEYGIDRLVESLDGVHEETSWAEYEPHQRLREMVANGDTGWPAGAGFYEWAYVHESFGEVEFEQREFIAHVTLNRPDKLNAMDKSTWRCLARALELAAEADDIRATILTGAGGAFSAGDDIAEMQHWEGVEDAAELFDDILVPVVDELRTHEQPVIAAVDGVAMGGGCELVLLSDLAVAGHNSTFALPESKIGAIPPLALTFGTASLQKKDLMDLALTGRQISAGEAEEMGIINFSVGGDQVADVARELARASTASAPSSVSVIKDIWSRMQDEQHGLRVRYAIDELMKNMRTDTGDEGLSAFVEKRDPDWQR